MIGKEVGPYRILDRLGGGGMGVVYRAEDTRLGRIVALKFLNLELLSNENIRKRFLHEARAASLIDHPNVCHVYEVGEAGGRTYMAMSYCEGRSLRELIDAGPVPPREAFSIAFGIAQGLWAAHRRGIVHRDIKPGNVLIGEDRYVRIADFGLALLVGHSRVTTSGVTVGTVAYMSPEQTSDSDVGSNTDIWSLGVTWYEMLAGRLPFRGEINAALVYSIVHEPHIPLDASIPEPCARIIDRCLEKEPAKRYQTVEELLEDMVLAARELGWESSVTGIGPILHERSRRRWRKRILVAAAAAVVVVGAAYAASWWGHRTPPVFVTQTRVAVLPFKNHLGPAHEPLVSGLGEHVTRVVESARSVHGSLWTVPHSRVVKAQLPDAAAAGPSFGVNRIITGDVQRYGTSARVTLELRDASNLDLLESSDVEFDPRDPTTLLEDIARKTAGLINVTDGEWSAPLRTRDGMAVREYLSGLGLLVPPSNPSPDGSRFGLAQAELDSCVHASPSFAAGVRAAGEAALIRYQRGLDAAALDHARACLAGDQFDGNADIVQLRGDVERMSGNADSAIATYRRAVRLDPGNYLAAYWLADLLASHDRIAEAESTYFHCIDAKPDFYPLYVQMGVFYYQQDRLDEAAASWQRSTRLAPRDAQTLSNLGAIHYRRNEWPQAREMFLESFRIKPDCESCNNLATTLYFDGKYEEAARYFEFAVQYCDTNDCMTWGNLASALYWADGKREQAHAVYRRAITKALDGLRAKPGDPMLSALLIDYYVMSEDTVRTRAAIAGAGRLAEENARVMYSVGSAYEKLGQRELALHYIGNAVRHDFPLQVINHAPTLSDLVKDPRFKDLIGTEAAGGAQAAHRQPE